MSKDDSMEVRIAMLEMKVDDLFIKIAQIRHEMATNRLEDRMARLEQLIASEFKQMVTKAEMRKDLLATALGIIAVQTAVNAAMISAVVQFLR